VYNIRRDCRNQEKNGKTQKKLKKFVNLSTIIETGRAHQGRFVNLGKLAYLRSLLVFEREYLFWA